MKLVLYPYGKDKLSIDVAQLAKGYGIAVLDTANLVYETNDEFLASLDVANEEDDHDTTTE